MSIDKQDFDRFMANAFVKLPGASEAGIKGELFDTMGEFVGDSNVWSEWIYLPVIANLQDYNIQPQEGGMIIRLVMVHDKNFVAMPALLPELRPPGAHLHLVWPQNINLNCKAYVIKNIVLPTTQSDVPDVSRWLFPVYSRQILDGLLGRMMTQVNKSYSNPQQGQYHLKRFRDGILVAKTAALRSNLFGGQSWRFPQSYKSSSQRGGVSTPFPSDSGWG